MPVPITSLINQVIQLGKETTYGTAVAPTRRLLGIGLTIGPEMEFQRQRPSYYKFDTSSVLNQESSSGSYSGLLSFDELPYILNSVIKTTTPTAAQAPVWVASTTYAAGDYVRPTTPNAHAYIVTVGGNSGAVQPTWPTGSGATVSLNGVTYQEVGSDVSGAFTWSYDVAENAPATFDTFTVQRGDISGGGGRGRRAVGVAFNGLSISSNRTGDLALSGSLMGRALSAPITMTTGGITETVPTPVGTKDVQVYCDATAAGLGTTKLGELNEISLELSGMRDMFWAHDRSIAGPIGLTESTPDLNSTFSVLDTTSSDPIFTRITNNAHQFVRFEALGPLAGVAVRYKITWDISCTLGSGWDYAEANGAQLISFPMVGERDAVWGKTMNISITNALATV